jgi:hypothetical protein
MGETSSRSASARWEKDLGLRDMVIIAIQATCSFNNLEQVFHMLLNMTETG